MEMLFVIATVVFCLTFMASIHAFSESGNTYNPAGTWRGGSSYDPAGDPYDDLGVRYLLTVIPIGRDRFTALWQGAFINPPEYTRRTHYSGEIVRTRDGKYECIGMALFNTSSAFPPDSLSQVWAIHGDMEFRDCDTVTITWDTFDVFDWHAVPFVDPPLFQPAPTPVVEIYKRFTRPSD
jgi:hypothetical protein